MRSYMLGDFTESEVGDGEGWGAGLADGSAYLCSVYGALFLYVYAYLYVMHVHALAGLQRAIYSVS